jgi:N-dimethylarginine dimethylaminohydrolase
MTAATLASPPRLLMCPPQHFAVTYSINPWMDPTKWADDGAALAARAAQQWMALHAALIETGATIETVPPVEGAPDLVFTANAAVVLDGKALLARFRHPERQIEEPVFAAAFHALAERGLIDKVIELPAGIALEGAGDCLWDRTRGLFWMGCGFRSDEAAAQSVQSAFGVPCLPLRLSEASYYHLDTAMCALPCGGMIYYPDAFTPAALETIHEHVAVADRIALTPDDAARFAANAVVAGRNIVLSSASGPLRRSLEERGYRVIETPLDAFQRSGGSACCLTLRLDHRAQAAQQAQSVRRAS